MVNLPVPFRYEYLMAETIFSQVIILFFFNPKWNTKLLLSFLQFVNNGHLIRYDVRTGILFMWYIKKSI